MFFFRLRHRCVNVKRVDRGLRTDLRAESAVMARVGIDDVLLQPDADALSRADLETVTAALAVEIDRVGHQAGSATPACFIQPLSSGESGAFSARARPARTTTASA